MGTDLVVRSKDNKWAKRARKAAGNHDEEIFLEGPKQIREALSGGWRAIALLLREGSGIDLSDVQAEIVVFSPTVFKGFSDTSTSQGVAALFERQRFDLESILEADGLVLVLDNVQDPGNVGAVIRLAAGFEAAGVVVLSGSGDPFSPKAIRGSSGAAVSTPIAKTDVASFLEAAQRSNRPIFCMMPDGPAIDSRVTRNAIIVLGSEGRGVSEQIAKEGTVVSIPISARLESLNVATAAAIVVWEVTRGGRR